MKSTEIGHLLPVHLQLRHRWGHVPYGLVCTLDQLLLLRCGFEILLEWVSFHRK